MVLLSSCQPGHAPHAQNCITRDARSVSIRLFCSTFVVRVTLGGIFFAFSAGIYYRNALAQIHSLADMQHLNMAVFTQGLSIFAGALFTMMIACLYVLRYRPVNKFIGWWPSIAAVLGGFLMFGLVWFPPRTDLPDNVRLFACGLIFVGNLLAAYILMHLGRSVCILTESRKLVTKGPYKIVRHPLYVAEMIAAIGQMILFLSVGAALLVVHSTGNAACPYSLRRKSPDQQFLRIQKIRQTNRAAHTRRLLRNRGRTPPAFAHRAVKRHKIGMSGTGRPTRDLVGP